MFEVNIEVRGVNRILFNSGKSLISLKVPLGSSHNMTVPALIKGLPTGYIVRAFTHFEQLEADAERILQGLQETQYGNQWIVVIGLSESAIEVLDGEERSLLGTDFRFQWEGSIGLIKVVPSPHNMITDPVTRAVDDRLRAMGVHREDISWAGTTTYKPTPTRGKQGDQAFLPRSRCPCPSRQRPLGWPTLVIETGVSASRPRLREDAKWWFTASDGHVRIVLVIGIEKNKVTFEKWQLDPSNTAVQQAYLAHAVEVTSAGIQGAPMILPFAALCDRTPGPREVDVVLDAQDFRYITHVLF